MGILIGQLKSQLLNFQKVFIDLNELEKLVGSVDYALFFQTINELILDGTIKPAGRKQDTNGKVPALSLKYRILRESEDNQPYVEEIKTLHPSMNISGYLENINLYKKHRQVIWPLCNYLIKDSCLLEAPMSKNERSYSIWTDEKMLDTSLAKAVLSFNGLRGRLNYYLTPEPFFDYVDNQNQKMNVLIIENKDTWFTLRRILSLRRYRCTLFDRQIDAILYGEGNKINRKDALTDYGILNYGDDVHYLYFGDLDYMGIELFLRVRKANPTLNIALFHELYEEMLAHGSSTLGKVKHNQAVPSDMADFLCCFSPKIQEDICSILTQSKYIPQEIMHYQRLDKLLTRVKGEGFRP